MKVSSAQYSILCTLIFAFSVTGCTTDGLKDATIPEKPEVITPLSATELCALYEVHKNLVDPLNGPVGGALCYHAKSLTHADLTEHQIKVFCRPGSAGYTWGLDLLKDAEEKRISVDWKKAKTCIAESLKLRQSTPGIELLKSEEWAALKQGICTEFYIGNSQQGEPCIRDWDCQLGHWCSSETPTEAGTRVCIKERNAGEACSDHIPCGPEFTCDQGVCIEPMADDPQPVLELGSPCVPEEEACAMIGNCIGCRPTSAVNAANPTCEILGSENDYCELQVHCAPDLGCTNNRCSHVSQGEVCMTTVDGPTQNICDSDSICVDACWQFDLDQMSCDASPGCVYDPEMDYCDSETMAGICTPQPMIGDDCLLGNYCTEGYCNPTTIKCGPLANINEACIPNEEDFQSNCIAGSFCINEICAEVCEYNEDCSAGEYCDTTSETEPPACKPLVAGECKLDTECGESQYCDRCELQGYNQPECSMDMDCAWIVDIAECRNECGALVEERTCSGNSNCVWDAGFEVCGSVCAATSAEECGAVDGCSVAAESQCINAVECWNFMDAESCRAGGCFFDEEGDYCTEGCSQYTTGDECNADPACNFDSDWGWCSAICFSLSGDQASCEGVAACAWDVQRSCAPAIDCTDFVSSDNACNNQPACSWFEAGSCGAANPQTTFECAEKNPIGSACRGDTMCDEGGICIYDENQEPRCHYPVPDTDPSCNYTSVEFLRGTFLLGMVFAFRRRRRRKA